MLRSMTTPFLPECCTYYCSTLWEHLRDEITEDPKDALQTSSEEEAQEHELYPRPETFLLLIVTQHLRI